MGSREYMVWREFHKLFPLDDERWDWRIGRAVAPVINVLKAAHFEKYTIVKASDWVPGFKAPLVVQDYRTMKAMLRGLAESAGKVVKKR